MNAVRRGRPRSERAESAILVAAGELLLAHGLQAMNMDEVAERAGVGKATIYRWWPSKEHLALDALSNEWEAVLPTAVADTGSLRDDLRARADGWLPLLERKPIARALAGLVAEAHANPDFATLYGERFHGPRRDATRIVLLRAIDRGEVRADLDLELALDLLYGVFWHRLLQGHAPLHRDFAYAAIDLFLAAVTAPVPTELGS